MDPQLHIFYILMLTPPMPLTAEEKYFLIRLLAGYRSTELNNLSSG
ncbi:MAG TPA: hypothetical protein PKL69_02970 [Agitococcus sp.]|nr:hypothetical protein [Agitococcus sp.]HNL79298.1 hypothetical protein [Agitococcus sp.]